MPEIQSFTVVAALLCDDAGRVLLTRRPPGRHMAGLWEFPGGKVDDGESPTHALVRELSEELGVAIEVGKPITFAVHEEPGMRILLLFYSARIVSGEPRPREGQAIAWVPTAELGRYQTPPADADLVRQLKVSEAP